MAQAFTHFLNQLNQPPSLAERSPGLARFSGIVGKLRGEAMIDNRTQVFDVAMKNARTIEACLDRLAMMGADHQLKLIAGRLSRLTQCAERRSRQDQLTNAAALAE